MITSPSFLFWGPQEPLELGMSVTNLLTHLPLAILIDGSIIQELHNMVKYPDIVKHLGISNISS